MIPTEGSALRVLEEGAGWLAVDKPAGLEVHPTKPDGPPTLWHRVRELLAYEIVNGGQVSIINRLDRETSGVTLIAKTAAAARHFSKLMERRAIAKEYFAICRGWPAADRFEIDAPLLRQGAVGPSPVWHRQAVHPAGRPALTRCEVLARFRGGPGAAEPLSRLRVWPETGRMHQIRVHLAHLGHPLVGDKLYGPDPGLYLEYARGGWTPALAAVLWLPRHALHCRMLRVPGDGLGWEAPLPADLAAEVF